MSQSLSVRLTVAEIHALLEALPRCCECRRRAELRVDGSLLCVRCAGTRRKGRVETPLWTNGAVTLDEALLSR